MWISSADGSYTAYSTEYSEHYHSTQEGALFESLHKHVIPTLTLLAQKERLKIVDICFGLGINTLATLYYRDSHCPHMGLEILSPELDRALIDSLVHFPYPALLEPYREVIYTLIDQGYYEDHNTRIDLIIDDARNVLDTLKSGWDIVYHDAFSLKVNPTLWSVEYFGQLARILHDEGVVSTYSTALQARLALECNGFLIYLNVGEGYRNATLASRTPLIGYTPVDMAHKRRCNPNVTPLSD